LSEKGNKNGIRTSEWSKCLRYPDTALVVQKRKKMRKKKREDLISCSLKFTLMQLVPAVTILYQQVWYQVPGTGTIIPGTGTWYLVYQVPYQVPGTG
jgi:hypothetical protein